jgi:DNA-binding MarR family transcriptional regulator
MESATAAAGRPTLLRDASRLQEALGELIRVLQFRDRDRACCYDLSVSQCHALQTLVSAGPITVNQLAAHLYLEKSTASRLANSLLRRDLIRKRSPESDGRVVILQVTESGLRLSRRINNDLTEEYTELLEGLDPGVREALPGLVQRLTKTIVARTGGEDPTCC